MFMRGVLCNVCGAQIYIDKCNHESTIIVDTIISMECDEI